MTWELVDNPVFYGRARGLLEPDCHDRSPFVTIQCACGFDNHVHESSIVEVPPDRGIGSRCNGCQGILEFPPGVLHNAFAELRRRGWTFTK